MNKRVLVLLLSFVVIQFFGQSFSNILILDKESNLPISNVRLICDDNIFYTNDDGKVIIPNNAKYIDISSPSYETIKMISITDTIKLSPKYTEIEKVNLSNLDIKNIWSLTIQNYKKSYGNSPILYKAILKQKAKENDKINNLLLADINIWERDNTFYTNKRLDFFVQLGFNKIKYYKTKKNDKNSPLDADIQTIPKDFIQKIFFDAYLTGVLKENQDIKIKSYIDNKNTESEKIIFKSESNKEKGLSFNGELLYNPNDKAISFFKIEGTQSTTKVNKKNKAGEDYQVETTNFSITYDFYKKDNKYFPSSMLIEAQGYRTYKNIRNKYSFFQEIIYQSKTYANNNGIKNKIDISKNITDNIPSNETSNLKVLLSNEEQQFIYE